MSVRVEDCLVVCTALGVALLGCGDSNEAGKKKPRGASTSAASGSGPVPNKHVAPRRVPRRLLSDLDDPADAPPRKRLSCKQGCEKLRRLVLTRDQKRLALAPIKTRPRLGKTQKKARVALVARCNRECAANILLAACLTAGDTLASTVGCLSTPPPPPRTTPQIAETKRRCATFLSGVKARSSCDELARLLARVAEAFGRVSNKHEFPKADERAIERCLGKSADVGKKQCASHRAYRVAAFKILRATFRN